MTTSSYNQRGITLVELAIAITIIGLLASGIIIGRDMIRNAELQKIASNFTQFRDAALLFKDKYKYLPGDFPDAVDIWGTGTCNDTASDTKVEATCNGNGNGFITGTDSTNIYHINDYLEAIHVWQHLSNAKLIPGTYSGRAGVGVTWWKAGTNAPQGIEESHIYSLSYAGRNAEAIGMSYSDFGVTIGQTYPKEYNHTIGYGVDIGIAKDEVPIQPGLSPADAYAIDAKADDGKPSQGNILAAHITLGGDNKCTDSSVSTNADYLPSEENGCPLIFVTGF